MEPAASDMITISITLIWTVIGTLASTIGILVTTIAFMHKQFQASNKAFSDTILQNTTQLISVTRDHAETNKALTKSVEQLPDSIFLMLQRSKIIG